MLPEASCPIRALCRSTSSGSGGNRSADRAQWGAGGFIAGRFQRADAHSGRPRHSPRYPGPVSFRDADLRFESSLRADRSGRLRPPLDLHAVPASQSHQQLKRGADRRGRERDADEGMHAAPGRRRASGKWCAARGDLIAADDRRQGSIGQRKQRWPRSQSSEAIALLCAVGTPCTRTTPIAELQCLTAGRRHAGTPTTRRRPSSRPSSCATVRARRIPRP